MVDRDVALEALSTILNASVTSVQKQSRESSRSRGGLSCPVFGFPFSKPGPFDSVLGGAAQPLLSVKNLISTVLDADETR